MRFRFAPLLAVCSVVAATILVMTASAPRSPSASLGPADAALLADAANFHALPAFDAIPAFILDCCADAERRLAKPGEPWAASDALSIGERLPRQRLLWAVQSENLTAVHYESGGFAHTYHVALLRRAWWPRDGALIWQGDTGQEQDTET